VTVSLGIFDLFTYAVPGALQLTVLLYIGQRLSWLDVSKLLLVPSGVLFVGLATASYLLGHVAYKLGKIFDRISQEDGETRWRQAQASFLMKVPGAHSRAFVNSDPYLLLAALELHAREVAVEISRLRAAGLMLRNSALPLTVSALVAVVELAVGTHKPEAAAVMLLLALAAFLSVQRSVQLRQWARSKTFQLAYWVPEIDERLTLAETTRRDTTGHI